MQEDLQSRFFAARNGVLAVIPEIDRDRFPAQAEEFSGLLAAAGWDSVASLRARLPHEKLPSLLRTGTLEEIAGWVEQTGATTVVLDAEADPSQQKFMEKIIKVPVLDRTGLILAIFGRRAVSHEARLQVELAQSRYTLPRLTRMWGHLGRIVSGGGTTAARGKGETQIEMDRRYLRERIHTIQNRLDRVAGHRARVQANRDRSGLPQVTLVGYTNAGKSSLLENLARTAGLSEDALFATLEAKVRQVRGQTGGHYLLADTVGFIDRLATELVDAFHATLEIAAHADLLIVVLDASDPDWFRHREVAEQILQRIGAETVPRVYCLNKLDRVEHRGDLVGRSAPLGPTVVYTSVHTGEGLQSLHTVVLDALAQQRIFVRVRVPAGEGARRALFYRESLLTHEQWDGEECILTGYLRSRAANEFLA